MNRKSGLAALAMLVLASVFASCARAAEAEDGAIAVLQSDKSPGDKAAACRTLKTIGTAKAVPALAPLLADKALAHWARVVLETMPCPEAGAALRDALPKAAGVTKAGICDSIGQRRDKEALPAMVEALKDADAQVVSSAATALGKIGGGDAAKALTAARANAPEPLRLVMADALLLCASTSGKDVALPICQALSDLKEPAHVRVAAFRAEAHAINGVFPLEAALTGNDRAAQIAALSLIQEFKDAFVTKQAVAALPKAQPKMQVALIEALRQRGDPAAGPAIVALLDSEEQPVRVAALAAIGELGDATIAPALAEAAAKAADAEQDAARECLNQLRDPKTRDVLLAGLAKAQPAVQAEMVRALGFRKETQAVPALLKMAQEGDEATRLVALKSLAMLADGSAAGDLIKLVVQAKSDAERDAAEQALGAVSGRGGKPEACVAQALAAMKDAAVPVRVALLRAAGRIGGPEALQALRAGLQDKDPAIQDAALRTLAESGGLEAAPDLLKLAKEAQSVPQRVLAMRGYWRLVAASAGRPGDERAKMCEAGMAAASRPEEKKLGLTELGKIAHAGALALAQTLCDDEAVRGEAEAACVQIAVALAGSQPAEAKAALQKLATNSKNDALRTAAKKALDGLDQYVGYITAWLAAGPYRQEGKQCKQLFDIPFPPEKGVAGAAPAGEVKWQPAPRPADAALFWQADLLPICGGEQCVVYLKTRVSSPKEQKVRLEIGSDDGVKVWVNGQVVHANNVERGIGPADDKAEAVLKEGWNDVLLKITQNVMGCAACVRIRNADGSVIEGLRFDTGEAR